MSRDEYDHVVSAFSLQYVLEEAGSNKHWDYYKTRSLRTLIMDLSMSVLVGEGYMDTRKPTVMDFTEVSPERLN